MILEAWIPESARWINFCNAVEQLKVSKRTRQLTNGSTTREVKVSKRTPKLQTFCKKKKEKGKALTVC